MAQHDYNIANQSFPSFRTDLNNALSAIQTTNSGTSLPTGAVAGQIWLDTTNATNPTLKFYDGADSISLATINYTTNTVDWLDSSITITGLSTTATGTVLTLSDTAHTTTVNLVLNNQTEIRFNELTANGTNYIGLKAPASLSADLTYTLPTAPASNNRALVSSTAGVMSFTPYSFPSADGTANQILSTNGSGTLSFVNAPAGTSWQSVQITGFTAVSGRGYPCNTTSSAFTVTLPASPTAGDYIQIVDYAGTFATNNITLGRNGSNINGSANNRILSTNREAVTITYVDATQGWVSTSASNYGTQSLDPLPYSIDFLVIGGGASGGYGNYGGGGGAGGYRTSTQTVSSGTVITVTVGDGGAYLTSQGRGNDGSASSISGSGLTTISSAGGGGGGGSPNANGVNGGSGGGGAGIGNGTAGTGNTPSTSPSQGNNGANGTNNNAGGGGGGAVEAGSTDGISQGGDGTASSITGSSVIRAGGGGGNNAGTGAIGGDGGGGTATADGGDGTANTGGGGGAHVGGSRAGAGGKGVVILSMPTTSYTGITNGSPTVTTSGSNTILQFNGSGSYTA